MGAPSNPVPSERRRGAAGDAISFIAVAARCEPPLEADDGDPTAL
jgi:hypothetical protein